jgi:hypothetical protein
MSRRAKLNLLRVPYNFNILEHFVAARKITVSGTGLAAV